MNRGVALMKVMTLILISLTLIKQISPRMFHRLYLSAYFPIENIHEPV
jgi:hypothetical protein